MLGVVPSSHDDLLKSKLKFKVQPTKCLREGRDVHRVYWDDGDGLNNREYHYLWYSWVNTQVYIQLNIHSALQLSVLHNTILHI